MIKTELLHPQIMYAIAKCGHGDKILITDGNYPLDSDTNENTEKIYLALKPGLPKATEVLKVLTTELNFEKAEVMIPENTEQEPEIFAEFKDILKMESLQKLKRYDFYDSVKQEKNVKLAINTGEMRTFANILLTVGVRE